MFYILALQQYNYFLPTQRINPRSASLSPSLHQWRSKSPLRHPSPSSPLPLSQTLTAPPPPPSSASRAGTTPTPSPSSAAAAPRSRSSATSASTAATNPSPTSPKTLTLTLPRFQVHRYSLLPPRFQVRRYRSKYSKPPQNPNPNTNLHPEFRKMPKPRFSPEPDPENGIAVTKNGIAYKIKDAPFEFQYSYTETPKVKPLALREQPYLPFGPGTMPRPWTGRKPLPESKKKLPEFDSFKLPPAGKKGVKPVQHPGPFLMGAGPKYTAMTREEVLGEPLTAEEVKELIKGCLKTKRQLNMG